VVVALQHLVVQLGLDAGALMLMSSMTNITHALMVGYLDALQAQNAVVGFATLQCICLKLQDALLAQR
jgi:hypothetical protein